MGNGFNENVRLLLQDTVRHRAFVAVCFVVIATTTLVVGLNWPKIYVSSTTIFVEEENILGPLMQGAAVQTEVRDRSSIARDMVFGRKLMFQLLERLGLLDTLPAPIAQEKAIEDIKSRTAVTGRNNLIRIEYQDKDPQMAFEVTRTLADLFIGESLADKARESQAAYDFIDQQVSEYKEKLLHSEEELKKFRSENIDARPGTMGEISRLSTELYVRLDEIEQELREARIKRRSLIQQLSGEAEAATSFSRSEQIRTRVADLQTQLDSLLLSYHETYPDIVHIKAQIADLRRAAEREKQMEAAQQTGDASSSTYSVDERLLANPLYQELQRALYNTDTLIETLDARYEQAKATLDDQAARSKRVEEFEAKLAELTRDYEVNKEIYTDLTRRRESARVSMNLDRERKGLTLRVDEPAYFPHQPSGLRFLHFAIAAPLAGLIVPLGILLALRQIDPRIRMASALAQRTDVILLGTIPHLATPQEARHEYRFSISLALFLLAAVSVMVAIAFMRVQGWI